jgi:hypothetical protein
MRTPTAVEFLDAWERGFDARQVERGLELLAIARPDLAREQLADLSIGARDAALLSLRETAFGPDMTALVHCPSCGEPLELAFTTADLRADTPANPPPLTLQHDGHEVQLRLLTSRDLAAAGEGDLEQRRRILLERCMVSARLDGQAAATPPAALAEAAVARLAAADAQADVQLDVSCAGCGHAWRAPFDIVSFLWTELAAWAERTLREVHVLASHYGWTEREILSLSALRRRHYLGMVRAWPIS